MKSSLWLAAVPAVVLLAHCSSEPGGYPDPGPAPGPSSGPPPGSSDAGSADATLPPDDPTPPTASLCDDLRPTDGKARLLGVYTLPPTSLRAINPQLTQAQLDDALTHGAGSVMAPALGSGLAHLGGCSFLAVTDRGPNGDRDSRSKTFPLPAFTPAIVEVHLALGGGLVIDRALPILTAEGNPVTGLSNTSADDAPYLDTAATEPLPLNPDGLDTEDVQRLPNGDLLVSDEYSPSLALVDGASGRVKVRYTPAGVTLPGSHSLVRDILPAALAGRRSNKGLEGLALSPDGKTAYAVLQTPMGDEKVYGKSLVNRLVRVDDVDDPAKARTSGHFVVLHKAAAEYGAKDQAKVFFNAATWLAPDRVLLLERSGPRLRVLLADLRGATDLRGQAYENTLDPESLAPGNGYAALGIVPAATREIYDSHDTPDFLEAAPAGTVVPDKVEGLAVISRTTIAFANDNDFGITQPKDASRVWVVRLKEDLPATP
jgi:hypothetical protein